MNASKNEWTSECQVFEKKKTENDNFWFIHSCIWTWICLEKNDDKNDVDK